MADGMKLRVRAATGGPTHKLTIAPPCRLQDLYDLLSALTSIPASSFSISLNKRDAIKAQNSQATLSSLGITGGDLIFYFTDLNSTSSTASEGIYGSNDAVVGFGSASAHVSPRATRVGRFEAERESSSGPLYEGRDEMKQVSSRRELCASAAMQRMSAARGFQELDLQSYTAGVGSRTTLNDATISFSKGVEPPTEADLNECGEEARKLVVQGECSNPDAAGASPRTAASCETSAFLGQSQGKHDVDLHETDQESSMTEIPIEDDTAEAETLLNYQFSVPDLLHRVLMQEAHRTSQRDYILVLALHAVMLETGFVRLESSKKTAFCDPYSLPAGWNRKAGSVSLEYTVSDLLTSSGTLSSETTQTGKVLLKCQMIGGFLVVYGTVLGGSRSEIHRLSLSSRMYLRESLGDSVEVSARSAGERRMQDSSTSVNGMEHLVENFVNIFEFWKEVKDKLSLRLLTSLCEIAGLTPPPSFVLLPTELKMRVLEMLPGPVLARMGCVCSELRFLTSSEDLWKEKCKQEFSIGEGKQGSELGWRLIFAREWVRRKRRDDDLRDRRLRFRPDVSPFRMRRPSYMGPGIRIIGGDYDIFPALPGGFRDRTNLGGFRGGSWGHGEFPRGFGGSDNASFESFC